jgi:hypothetical protein
MSGFSAEWLALRAPADSRARAVELEAVLGTALATRAAPLTCVDLACGTGANVLRLAPRLPGAQQWKLVDADAALLGSAVARCSGLCAADGATIAVQDECVDLASADLRELLDGAELVTASALLDLVSESWLERLADAVVGARAIALFALDYGGRRACDPPDPWDARAHRAFDRHQCTVKSFGVALGPDAAGHAVREFRGRDCKVLLARSDWILGPGDEELQRALLRGWAAAATEIDPEAAAEYADWLGRRLAHVAAGASRLRVGHEDMLVLPRER